MDRTFKPLPEPPKVSATVKSTTYCELDESQVRGILAAYLTRELGTPVSPDKVRLCLVENDYWMFDRAVIEVTVETTLPKPPVTRGGS